MADFVFVRHGQRGGLTEPPSPSAACPVYKSRNPRGTSLYQLLEAHFETLKGLWEERFERRYGFWRVLSSFPRDNTIPLLSVCPPASGERSAAAWYLLDGTPDCHHGSVPLGY